MSNRINSKILIALMINVLVMMPVLAAYRHPHDNRSYYAHSYHGNVYYANPYNYPNYNNAAYRGYAPYVQYAPPPDHTIRNVAIGAGIGVAAGAILGSMLASYHGH